MDPLFGFAIYVTQVHASNFPTMSSTYAIRRSRVKRRHALVRIYTYTMSDMRDPMER
jgi:hypothetical protein